MKNRMFKFILVALLMFLTIIVPTRMYAEEPKVTKENYGSPQEKESTNESKIDVTDSSKQEKEIIDKIIETPASVNGEKYSGSGTVVDFTTTGSKAFYTVKAKDHSIYYIVIDLDKTEDNVYFLSEINGENLTLGQVQQKNNNNVTAPTQETPKEITTKSSDYIFYLHVVLMAVGVFVFGYFKKVKKNKPNAKTTNIFTKRNKNTSSEITEGEEESEFIMAEEDLVDDEDDE